MQKMDNIKSIKPSCSGNSIMVRPDGPLICKGDMAILLLNADDDVILENKEFALCRCGHSSNKPFCDGTHKKENFQATQHFDDSRAVALEKDKEQLTITVKENAMYSVKGAVTIFSRDGLSKTTRNTAALCRCGYSKNKPFCDINHKKCDFTAK